MGASEMAYPDLPDGTPHPATLNDQPPPTMRRMEGSEIAFGDTPPSGLVPIEPITHKRPEDYERDT